MRRPFERWHPKVALRYLPIVEEIKRSDLKDFSVLEIGSGSLGIAPYLGKKVIGVDVDFSGPKFELLYQVIGEATNLPFANNSFDFVVMVDVLEHLPWEKRPLAIFEALRCAKKEVFIAAPCGQLAFSQDKQLDCQYRKIFGKPFDFLREHLNFELPEEGWINDTIEKEAKKLKKKVEIRIEGNINLSFRKFLMWGWMTKNKIIDFIFRKVFLIFIPIFRHFNQEPTYRKIFFVKILS